MPLTRLHSGFAFRRGGQIAEADSSTILYADHSYFLPRRHLRLASGYSMVRGPAPTYTQEELYAISVMQMYARELKAEVDLVRGIYTVLGIRARVYSYQPKDVVGTFVQGDQIVILFRPDLESVGLAPPMRGDKILIGPQRRKTTIQADDANTRVVDGVIVADEVKVRGD